MFFSDSKHSSTTRSSISAKASSRVFLGLPLALAFGLTPMLVAGCASQTSTASIRNAQGVESFTSGRYDDAITLFQESLENNPENAEAYYNLASAYQSKATQSGDMILLGQAEDAYWTALEHDPKPETIVCCYRGLATSAMARGDSNGALQTLEAWRDRNPESIEPRLEIAYLLEAQQKDEQAYDMLKEIATDAPGDYRPYYKMGILAERAGDLEDAIENANVAYKLNPTDTTVAQRVSSIEAQVAAQRRKDKEEFREETALAKAEFADPAAIVETTPPIQTTPIQTTPVQTTSARAQESEASSKPQTETPTPKSHDAPFEGIPTSEFRGAPVEKMQSLASAPTQESNATLGFGDAVAYGANRSQKAESTLETASTLRKSDDSDVKWIASQNAERIRKEIAQTSATTVATTTGFNNVVSDGAGVASSKLPNKTITTAQFETPAFAVGAGTDDAQIASTASAEPSVPTPPAPTARQTKTVDAQEKLKPRAELNSGPPRISAGSFF